MPNSHRKEGELLFKGCTDGSIETKATKKDDRANIAVLKENIMVPTLKAW